MAQPRQASIHLRPIQPSLLFFRLENGCLLSGTNAAYIRTCLMPNGNAVVTGNIPVSCPDGLSALQDPQKSGFFL
ncbi:hypothetical protein GBF38_009025 [Nibea albiflora]|uniref:Uncharacterized protein n=1 Tax=Nibea albiflora TaxID=240163 RepID=A0ACB7ES47_NIBAL|nr:hypothetical protein GBF38_009025 [Nibea albiflora]